MGTVTTDNQPSPARRPEQELDNLQFPKALPELSVTTAPGADARMVAQFKELLGMFSENETIQQLHKSLSGKEHTAELNQVKVGGPFGRSVEFTEIKQGENHPGIRFVPLAEIKAKEFAGAAHPNAIAAYAADPNNPKTGTITIAKFDDYHASLKGKLSDMEIVQKYTSELIHEADHAFGGQEYSAHMAEFKFKMEQYLVPPTTGDQVIAHIVDKYGKVDGTAALVERYNGNPSSAVMQKFAEEFDVGKRDIKQGVEKYFANREYKAGNADWKRDTRAARNALMEKLST